MDTTKIDIISDIIDIPVKSNSYDNILCTEVLEHIKKPDLAIKEFSRILRKKGKLFLTAPFFSYTHMAPYHFCSGFNRYWYETLLPEYDFKIIEIVASGNYFDSVAVDLRRTPLISKTYSKALNLFQKSLLVLCIRMFNKLSKNNHGSEEFGNFEYMIVAEKI